MIDLNDISNLILLLLLYCLPWILNLNYVFFTWLTKENYQCQTFVIIIYKIYLFQKKIEKKVLVTSLVTIQIGHWFGHRIGQWDHRIGHGFGYWIGHRIDQRFGHRIDHRIDHKFGHRVSHKFSHIIGNRICHYTLATNKIATDAFGH